ncbi:MAG: response regulator, partial [Bacteroidaceae bacterium]|nr:response regulator [Bacteroidaceae bacterium]
MKVLIVEDETAAYDNLVEILAQLDPLIEVVGNTESVNQTMRWLEREPAPELIFMDINLSDGSAFAIFDRMKVTTPIVFVTAYDQFAIDAFKVNSIDYLLKPVNPEDVAAALEKFKQWGNRDVLQYISRLSSLSVSSMYRDRVIVQVRDK